MNIYPIAMGIGSAAIFALYGLRLSRVPALRRRAVPAALCALVLGAVLGLVMARVSYALLMQELDFEYDGLEALGQLLEIDIDHVSFFGGAVGVCLGVMLSARLLLGQTASAMDAFAPCGALLVALFRLGEIAFGSFGTGAVLDEDSPLAFFPLALKISVDGGYSYWGWAVCVLSALLALIWAVVAFLPSCGSGRKGRLLTLTLYFLCLPQVLCESLRRRGMYWLFVHVEQVLCVIVLIAVLLVWTLGGGKKLSFVRRFAPLGGMAVCAGGLVAAEFAIDGKLFDLPYSVCYGFMLVLIVCMGVCGLAAQRHWCEETK